MIPIRQFIRICRQYKSELKFADSTGLKLTGGQSLLFTLIFKKVLHRLLAADEQNVGILMPTSVYGVLVNLGLALDRRTSVNLNYTFNNEILNYCVKHAGIKHVITSKKVLERMPNLKLDAELVVMEDAAKHITFLDKAAAAVDAYVTPIVCLEWAFGLTKVSPESLLTIIFTSGSTGTPKGAMLTHNNIASNVGAFLHHLNYLTAKDRILGTLPLFHAFGFTTGLWLPAMTFLSGVYHFNPLEPKKVAETARTLGATAFPTTPTFLRTYLRRSEREDYADVPTVVCGAEKLPQDLLEAWYQKFGVRPVEGYGTTEMSPVVSTNVPKTMRPTGNWSKEGTIGKPLPNIKVRIVHPETGEVLGTNTPGMLQLAGPSVMEGYYKAPEKTAEVFVTDSEAVTWYITGDIAEIDADGFIKIVGRQSRISKIGGEMVPHILIEEVIGKILAITNPIADAERVLQEQKDDDVTVAVAAVPDVKKGERLVVFHTDITKTPEEICKLMQMEGLPNLWIPSPHDFHKIDTIPLLGTGKLDLRAVKELAEKISD